MVGAVSQISSYGQGSAAPAHDDEPVEKMPPYQKVGYAERIIETFYVDSVASDEMVQKAIEVSKKLLNQSHNTAYP